MSLPSLERRVSTGKMAWALAAVRSPMPKMVFLLSIGLGQFLCQPRDKIMVPTAGPVPDCIRLSGAELMSHPS